MRIAGLDLGTNTFLCLIADIATDGSLVVVRDDVRVVRLGQGVNATRELHEDALQRADETLCEFSEFIKSAKCDKVLAVATSAARDVKNGQRLLDLGKKYNIPIEIISGEKEAELTFAGAIEKTWSGLTAVIDVGGGSTEIILGDQTGILARVSADVGSVRMTEMYIAQNPISSQDLKNVHNHVRVALTAAAKKIQGFDFKKISNVIGVAGTPTTIAAVDRGQAFESDQVHGYTLSLEKIDNWTERFASLDVKERQKFAGMDPKRADVIVAGAICLSEAMRTLGAECLLVSIRGLRYGVVQWCAAR